MFHLRKAVELQPELADAHYNLAIVLTVKKQFNEAISEYEKVLAIQPDHADARNNLGHMLLDRGQLTEAVEQFRRR